MHIEGLNETGEIADLQRAFEKRNATQCGFCAPGMLLTALLRNPKPSCEQIRSHISANHCCCTGYEAIVVAVETVAAGRATA